MAQSTSSNNLVKQVQETRTYSMDFANLMASDETITSIDSVASELRGGDSSDLVLTGETIVGQTITVIIASGTRSHTYRVEITISTSGGQVLQGDGLLRISN